VTHRKLELQNWVRGSDLPAISLGDAGAFDDMHIFAPCVAYERGEFRMWYCGSQGDVAGRVFRLGLATSHDGLRFVKHAGPPVYEFGDDRHSVLTPTLLRTATGSLLRENGKLRMWFSAADLGADGVHTLHDATSADGVEWSAPSEAQLENVYAPTVIWEEGVYRMWYSDVTADPWSVRQASSVDGNHWDVDPRPALVLDQEWETGRLFYPTVLCVNGSYILWYGSYDARQEEMMTALGVALSDDGNTWHKAADNPVFEPEPSHSWESHYTTSQSVVPLPDGSLMMWYATRTGPPFTHKYFAIGAARWPNALRAADTERRNDR